MKDSERNFYKRLDACEAYYQKSLIFIQRSAENEKLTSFCVESIFGVYEPKDDVKEELLGRRINIESLLKDLLPKIEENDYDYVVNRVQEELDKF